MGEERSWKSSIFQRKSEVVMSEKERELTTMYLAALSSQREKEETEWSRPRERRKRRQFVAGDLEEFLSNNDLIDLDEDEEEDSDEESDRMRSVNMDAPETWDEDLNLLEFDNEEAVRQEEYYEAADGILQALADTSQAAQQAPSARAVARVREIRQALLEQQAAVVDQVKNHSKDLAKAISRHTTVLQKRLKWIMERGLRRPSDTATNDALLREAQGILEELKASSKEGEAALLDHYFPTVLDWKLRLSTGDGSFLGVRDLDIDAISADVTFSVTKNRGITSMEFHVSAINATVTVFDFQIKGSNLRAKFSKLLLTPTVNCIRIAFTGDYTLVLDYEPGMERNNYQPSWHENKQKSSLKNLHISKQMSGVSALQLPHKLVESLATSVLPSAINNYVMKAFRPEIGELIQRTDEHIQVTASVRIEQQLNSLVWRAPLASNTDNARRARQAAGLTYEQCAWLDFVLRKKLARTAGFDKKGISLHRLFRWRRGFAAHTLESLNPLIQALQTTSITRNRDPSLLFNLLHTVEKLAAKKLCCSVAIDSMRVNVGLEAVFKRIRERHLAEFISIQANTVAERRYARLRRSRVEALLRDVESQFREQVLPYLGQNSGLTIHGQIEGGLRDGQFMLTSDDFRGLFRLPPYFTMNDIFGQPPIHHEGEEFVLTGRFVPSSGAYVVCITPRSMYQRREATAGASASLKGLNIQVSPAQHPGFIMLSTEQIRCSSSTQTLAELSESFMYTSDSTQEENSADAPFQETEQVRQSRTAVANCRDRYYASRKQLEELSRPAPNVESSRSTSSADYSHPFIPWLLLDPDYAVTVGYENLRVDITKEEDNSDRVQFVITTNNSGEDEEAAIRMNLVSTLQSFLQTH